MTVCLRSTFGTTSDNMLNCTQKPPTAVQGQVKCSGPHVSVDSRVHKLPSLRVGTMYTFKFTFIRRRNTPAVQKWGWPEPMNIGIGGNEGAVPPSNPCSKGGDPPFKKPPLSSFCWQAGAKRRLFLKTAVIWLQKIALTPSSNPLSTQEANIGTLSVYVTAYVTFVL